MARQLFRVVCLTLVTGTALSCAASEKEPAATADFTATIPKTGLERSVEKVFFLGPSNTLQVIDQTGAAVYLPEKSDNTQQSSSKPYSVAYRFENGACDFTKTVDFKDIFPDYTTAVWDKQQKDSETSGGGSAEKVVKYRFTNPPAEYLGEGLSFCVRFKTVLAAGLGSPTKTSTSSTSDGGSGAQTPDDETTEEESPQEQGPSQGPVGDSSPGDGSQSPSEEVGQQLPSVGQGENEEDNSDVGASPAMPGVVAGGADSPAVPGEPPAHNAHEDQGSPSVFSPQGRVTADNGRLDHDEGHEGEDAIQEPSGVNVRRLDAPALVQDAYLTIVVHSAAWSSASGIGALSGILITVTVTLLQIW
ncbi:Toxoplasma gondii family A protein [Toxoplasma gondii VAND]|uniref:Toxoplasma gondii family A protein n=1 Tax=Toxoplasma gondii VAND TaxID=933077 RepID=A0A086Q9P0_TOXGO|nr:Toxoplasma gondii family A protein [Toxoplasma gondii VAND]